MLRRSACQRLWSAGTRSVSRSVEHLSADRALACLQDRYPPHATVVWRTARNSNKCVLAPMATPLPSDCGAPPAAAAFTPWRGYFYPAAVHPLPPVQRVMTLAEYCDFVRGDEHRTVGVVLAPPQEVSFFSVRCATGQMVGEPQTFVDVPARALPPATDTKEKQAEREEGGKWFAAIWTAMRVDPCFAAATTVWYRCDTGMWDALWDAHEPLPVTSDSHGAEESRWVKLSTTNANLKNSRLVYSPEHLCREMQYSRIETQ